MLISCPGTAAALHGKPTQSVGCTPAHLALPGPLSLRSQLAVAEGFSVDNLTGRLSAEATHLPHVLHHTLVLQHLHLRGGSPAWPGSAPTLEVQMLQEHRWLSCIVCSAQAGQAGGFIAVAGQLVHLSIGGQASRREQCFGAAGAPLWEYAACA